MSVVVNFSNHKWDGPLSLHEMFAQDVPFDKEPSERYNVIKEMIPDYRIILIDPHQMESDELNRFNTKLGTVLTFIKNSDDKKKLADTFKNDNISELDIDSVMVINACTGANIPLPEKDEVIKMCKAIEDLRNDARLENQNEMIEALKANGVSDELIQAALKTMQEMHEKKNA